MQGKVVIHFNQGGRQMEYPNYAGQEQVESPEAHQWAKNSAGLLNFDIHSYQFHDLDLAMAASQLSHRDRTILILHLMGHTQDGIAEMFPISRSMISKRLTIITEYLKQKLNRGAR